MPTSGVVQTTLTHPPLPSTASLIERIALPMVFSVLQVVIKNPTHAEQMKDYMLALRDSINAAYPGE